MDGHRDATPVDGGTGRAEGAGRALVLIALGQLLALTLWFSASAVAPTLADAWALDAGQTAGLTLAVQVGFVIGAVLIAMLNLADIVASRRLFVVAAIVGSLANALFAALGPEDLAAAFLLRAVTGMALAGVYPSGLKVMAGWFLRGRGMALGVLVGALTVGSAGPHLIRGFGFDWRVVILAASALALAGAAVMAMGVGDGPFEVPTQRFSVRQVGRVLRNRGFRLSTYGYLGHMWELYAMWTWVAAYIGATVVGRRWSVSTISALTFGVIAIGGVGAWAAGILADRHGREPVAGSAMAISGACAAATAAVFGAPAWVLVPVLVLWGVTVVADSAQFSALVTETADDEVRGTALALQTAVGFLLTLVTIRGVPALAEVVGWRYAFVPLALGPLFGIWAMWALRTSGLARPSVQVPTGP